MLCEFHLTGLPLALDRKRSRSSFNTQFKTGFAHIELMVDQVSPLGADAAVTIGKYHLTGQERSGPLKVDGHWSEVEVREGGVWKIRLLTVTPKTEPKAVVPSIEANSTTASPESKFAGAGTAGVLVNIDKTNQKMTVFLDGVETYYWPVSTGKQGYSTPTGTYTATSMNEIWYSKQWDNAACSRMLRPPVVARRAFRMLFTRPPAWNAFLGATTTEIEAIARKRVASHLKVLQ